MCTGVEKNCPTGNWVAALNTESTAYRGLELCWAAHSKVLSKPKASNIPAKTSLNECFIFSKAIQSFN
jgi:hypothetical protein